MAKKKNSNGKFIAAIVVLCVILAVVSAAAVYFYINGRNLSAHSNSVEGSLSAARDELESYEDALSGKQDEVEYFSRIVDEQSSAFESEKNELNEKISDLNKQISLKRQREAESRAAAAAAAAAATANGVPAAVPQPAPAPSGGKTIYLTFDDGPSPNTPRILDILDSYGVKATFFVINTGYNSYMKDIVNRGHTIALHAYTHNYKTIYSSDEAYYNDLQKISDVVFNNTGVRTNIIRFPGGSSNTVSRNYCSGIMTRITKGVQSLGYQYYDWNCSSQDASGHNVAVETIVSSCKKVPSSNTVIVLMHDTGAKNTTVAALPQVIEYYRSCGYSFAAITSATPPVHHRVNN